MTPSDQPPSVAERLEAFVLGEPDPAMPIPGVVRCKRSARCTMQVSASPSVNLLYALKGRRCLMHWKRASGACYVAKYKARNAARSADAEKRATHAAWMRNNRRILRAKRVGEQWICRDALGILNEVTKS